MSVSALFIASCCSLLHFLLSADYVELSHKHTLQETENYCIILRVCSVASECTARVHSDIAAECNNKMQHLFLDKMLCLLDCNQHL